MPAISYLVGFGTEHTSTCFSRIVEIIAKTWKAIDNLCRGWW